MFPHSIPRTMTECTAVNGLIRPKHCNALANILDHHLSSICNRCADGTIDLVYSSHWQLPWFLFRFIGVKFIHFRNCISAQCRRGAVAGCTGARPVARRARRTGLGAGGAGGAVGDHWTPGTPAHQHGRQRALHGGGEGGGRGGEGRHQGPQVWHPPRPAALPPGSKSDI